MDPNPKKFPIVSYVMSKIPQLSTKPPSYSDFDDIDIEQPQPRPTESPNSNKPEGLLMVEMPHLKDPEVIASMTKAISDVFHTRSILKTLGDRPDHESVDVAKSKITEIECSLSKQLEEIVLESRPNEIDLDRENEIRLEAEKEKSIYRAVVQLDEMHESYEKLLRSAEDRLVKIYGSAEATEKKVSSSSSSPTTATETEENKVPVGDYDDEVNEEVVSILQEALSKQLEKIELSGRQLRFLPEAFGKLHGLISLDLSHNQLQVIPDSIAGLQNLEELNLSSNLLESLPDSIGLLLNLKLLNVSSNKLNDLPDSISHCRSLVELDASYNHLGYLPTNIGYELVNLQKLFVNLNKLRSLPTSICELRSLQHLDARFNELHGLPHAIGLLTNLEILNISSNFSDMTVLPDTIGDLINLKELDLSNNQISALPVTFGRLENLRKLNLEQNPLTIPPTEIVNRGVEAVKEFMSKLLLEILIEEERKSTLEANNEQAQTGWLTRSTSWLKNVTGYLGSGANSPRDHYLDQQL